MKRQCQGITYFDRQCQHTAVARYTTPGEGAMQWLCNIHANKLMKFALIDERPIKCTFEPAAIDESKTTFMSRLSAMGCTHPGCIFTMQPFSPLCKCINKADPLGSLRKAHKAILLLKNEVTRLNSEKEVK